MSPPRLAVLVVLLLVSLIAVACRGADGPATSESPAAAPTPDATASPAVEPSLGLPPTQLTVGLGYIPSVQFARFYLADQAGYYREAGLEVTFQNRIDPDLITLVGQGAIDVGIADGTSMIPAVSQGIPVRYVATVYGQFPSIVFGKTSTGVLAPADLAGKRLGIPGRYGSSWIMLQALLASAGLTPEDLEIVEYPDFRRLTLCDVPGLIAGAHENIGLGHKFLRHIARCPAVIILLDMAGTDNREPLEDYKSLLQELELYDPALMKKPRLVVANKMDEPQSEANLKAFKRKVRKVAILPISAAFGEGMPAFVKAIRELVEDARETSDSP